MIQICQNLRLSKHVLFTLLLKTLKSIITLLSMSCQRTFFVVVLLPMWSPCPSFSFVFPYAYNWFSYSCSDYVPLISGVVLWLVWFSPVLKLCLFSLLCPLLCHLSSVFPPALYADFVFVYEILFIILHVSSFPCSCESCDSPKATYSTPVHLKRPFAHTKS